MAVVTQSTIGVSLLRALLFPILFLAPGLLALRPTLWTARLGDTLSRLQKVVYSVVLSTASVLGLYLGWSLLRWEFLSPDDTVPFWTFVVAIPVHFFLTGVIGVTAGAFIHNYVETGPRLDETDNWEFALSRYGNDEVVVRTCGGKEVRGEVVDTAVFDREEGLEASQSDTDELNTARVDNNEGILLTDPSVADPEDEKKVEGMYSGEQQQSNEQEESSEQAESSGQEVSADSPSDNTEPLHLSDEDTNYAYFPRDDVEGILFLDKLTKEKGPRLSRDDRAQEFLGDVMDELAPQKLTPDTTGTVRTHLYRLVLAATLLVSIFSSGIIRRSTFRMPLGVDQTLILISGLLAVFSTVLLINEFSSVWQQQWLTFALLVLSFITPVAVSHFFFSLPNSLSLLSGATLALLLSPTYVYTTRQYDWRPAAYTTLAVFSFASLSHTFQFGVWPQSIEQLSATGVVFWIGALLVNRLRVSDGSGFNDTAKVTADGVVWLLVTFVSAAVVIPSRIPYTVSTTVYKFGSLLVGIVLGSFLVWRAAER